DNLIELSRVLQNNLKVAFDNNPSATLKTRLSQPLSELTDSLENLTQFLEILVNKDTFLDFEQVAQQTNLSLQSSFKLWDQTEPALSELLILRIQGFQQRQWFLSLFVLLALAIAVYLYIGFYRSLMLTISRLRAASERMVAGDQSHPLRLETQDEMTEVVAAFNTVADALRQTEAKFRGIVENAVVGIYQTSLEGQFLTANPRLSQICGYSSSQEMVETLTDIENQLYVNRDRRQEFIQCLEKEDQLSGFESEIYCQDGTTLWISESARSRRNDQGQLIGFEGTMIDISQKKRDELEIAHLTEQLQSENLRMGAELNVTRRLQQMLMPSEKELSSVVGLDISGFMEPADEVGGDYYDIQQFDGKTRISIGDVTGHGLESNLVMIMAQTAVRTLIENGETDTTRLLNAVNRTIYDNTRRMGSYKNMTLVLLEYEAGLLHLSGQHEEVIVIRNNGAIELIDTFELGFPLGLESDISQFVGETTLQLHAGDLAVLYTDGITEAMNPEKQQYGLENMQQVLVAHRHQSAEQIRQAVIADLRHWIHTQKVFDDITLLILKQQ
ncbi:MAG: SpoIIE family protein phosphatase, partial [Microcystaceae cyanobacterium]